MMKGTPRFDRYKMHHAINRAMRDSIKGGWIKEIIRQNGTKVYSLTRRGQRYLARAKEMSINPGVMQLVNNHIARHWAPAR